MKSYLLSRTSNEVKDYSRKTTYVSGNSYSDLLFDLYHPLPEEYDVFTCLDSSFFTNRETRQQKMISDCLIYIRKALLSLFASKGIVCVLPKLSVLSDDNGTVTFNWAYSTFRAFLSFDDERGGNDSYCGIVFQTDRESVSTQTKRICKTNYKKVIDELLDLVIYNS